MHYYQFNIGDYRRDTSHLSLLEHGIYRQLLDQYYLTEQPINADDAKVMRSLCVRSADEMQALTNVLDDFFAKTESGYIHKRCDIDIAEFHGKSESSRVAANVRWAKAREANHANALQSQSERYATAMPTINHEPLTINQEPEKREKKRATRLLSDFQLPDDWFSFCQTERPDLDPQKTFDKFRDYWTAKAGKDGAKLDWLATWRNWVRDERKQQGTARKSFSEKQADRISEFTGSNIIEGGANVIAISGY